MRRIVRLKKKRLLKVIKNAIYYKYPDYHIAEKKQQKL